MKRPETVGTSDARRSAAASGVSPSRRRWNGEALLSGALLAILLTGYAALLYITTLIVGSWLLGDPHVLTQPPLWLNLLTVAAVAATVLPVARWLRGGIHDIVYAQHDDPYALVGKLNVALQRMANPQATLPAVTQLIAADLRLPHVAIETIERGGPAAHASTGAMPPTFAFGPPVAGAPVHRIPIAYLDRPMGTLVVGARAANRSLSPRDVALLGDIARQLAIALYAAQLTHDVRTSRERLVAAREEERRRIRNDLHDELAPTLSSLQLQLGAILRLMRTEPEEAERMAAALRESVRGATAEIRRLVHDLRPPMLDAFGLVGAIRQLYDGQAADEAHAGIAFDVCAPEPMPALPAAVEVAAYRIASEAVHNAIRHSGARRCTVTIDVADDALRLEVRDDGAGFPAERPAGVGTASMHERAAELGGTLTLDNAADGGARVVARLPMILDPPGTDRPAGESEPWNR